MMSTTAPPSEQYNDPSLRTRSNTITKIIEREDLNSSRIFTRIDLINSDWKSQDKMDKINKLKSAPPTYSPPKPPPLTHNFHSDTKRKKSRARFNTFTSENFQNKLNGLNIVSNKKKKKKNPSDIFKMKVFQTTKSVGYGQDDISSPQRIRHSKSNTLTNTPIITGGIHSVFL